MPPSSAQAVLAVLVLLTLTACNNPSGAYERRSVSSAEALARVERNPAPTQGHRIVVSVDGAPGPLTHAKATAHYTGVDSYGCRYPTTGLGTFSVPNPSLPVPVTRLPDGRFELTIYDDAFLETDLFGTGVCEWLTSGPTIALRASDGPEPTIFILDVLPKALRDRSPTVRYYWRGNYPVAARPGFGDSGAIERERYGPDVQDKLFTITATFDEAMP